MKVLEATTEQMIKDTAKRVFFTEGRLQATTQDIADAAGVSRTSLHYYFRSKDVLLAQVFGEAMQTLSSRLYAIMASELPFRAKMEQTIETFLQESIAYPYTETFLVQAMLMGNDDLNSQKLVSNAKMKPFLAEIQLEMDQGRLTPMDPVQFMMNVLALTAHPFMMRPLQQRMFGLSDHRYLQLMKDRKKVICELILK